jgi:hypothetical protein
MRFLPFLLVLLWLAFFAGKSVIPTDQFSVSKANSRPSSEAPVPIEGEEAESQVSDSAEKAECLVTFLPDAKPASWLRESGHPSTHATPCQVLLKSLHRFRI